MQAVVASAACKHSPDIYVAKREDLEWTARDLFQAIGNGILDANINYEYALKDAVKAHEEIESGRTVGATVLIP